LAIAYTLGFPLVVRAVVFDVDGVLIDSSARFRVCLEEVGLKDLSKARGLRRRLFWECFLSNRYIHLDRVRADMAGVALDYARRGYKVIVVTGRPKTMERETLEQLREAGLTDVEVYFRRPGDYRSDEEYKLEVIRKLLAKYEIEAVYDDSETVIRAIKRELPEIKAILVAPP